MSLSSSFYPEGAQFDDNAPWEPDFVERSIHEVESFVSPAEPVLKPQTERNRAWRKSLADSLQKEAI